MRRFAPFNTRNGSTSTAQTGIAYPQIWVHWHGGLEETDLDAHSLLCDSFKLKKRWQLVVGDNSESLSVLVISVRRIEHATGSINLYINNPDCSSFAVDS